MADWLTPAFVAAHVDVEGTPLTGPSLANVTAAASAYVQRIRDDLPWSLLGFGWKVPPDIKLGAAMLAWRLYQRRAAPLGITTSPTGDPVEILRSDPDIARLLGIEGSGRFVFGAPRDPVAPTSSGSGIRLDEDGTPYLAGAGGGIALDDDGTPYLTGGA